MKCELCGPVKSFNFRDQIHLDEHLSAMHYDHPEGIAALRRLDVLDRITQAEAEANEA